MSRKRRLGVAIVMVVRWMLLIGQVSSLTTSIRTGILSPIGRSTFSASPTSSSSFSLRHHSTVLLQAHSSQEKEKTPTNLSLFSTDHILEMADDRLSQQQRNQENHRNTIENRASDVASNRLESVGSVWNATLNREITSRRMLIAESLIAAGFLWNNFGLTDNIRAEAWTTEALSSSSSATPVGGNNKFSWQTPPYNKRTGVTVYEAEQAGYNVRFVTYLARFLLCFDPDCQVWWWTTRNRRTSRKLRDTEEEVQAQRLAQFGALAASVEVGLLSYVGPDGPDRLMRRLLQRYGPDAAAEAVVDDTDGTTHSTINRAAEVDRRERTRKSARRHIALLFGLMEENQPTEQITKLLAAIDNGSVARVQIVNPGSGYAPGYGSPQVTFPSPEGGAAYNRATGRAVLSPNGKLLRVDVVNRGSGYVRPPSVTIAPPAAGSTGRTESSARKAQAVAVLFRNGPNKGRIERIQLTDPGMGYSANEIIQIRFSSPETRPGVPASATAVLEYQVSDIVITNNGTGYAVEKPMPVTVEPPPLTARVNLNDPLSVRVIPSEDFEPRTTTARTNNRKRKLTPQPDDPDSVTQVVRAAAQAKSKGCLGRACYDEPVQAIAYPVAERDSYSAFRTLDDVLQPQRVERAIVQGLVEGGPDNVVYNMTTAYVSASSSSARADDSGLPDPPNFGAGASFSSTQLLSLLPAGVGLEYSNMDKRYILSVDTQIFDAAAATTTDKNPEQRRAYDPDFGPRGRSPIERDMELGISTYLRFVASGAVCCSGVHLALTPIDVVKTKVQTDPQNYPGIVRGFQRTLAEGGASGFFAGWKPTFLGFFAWGGISYALTEFLRRYITTALGNSAGSLEVPIILAASAIGSFVGAFILCPFESVRIRSVAQPDYGDGMMSVVNRMVKEEGLDSLFKAVPAFCAKEIPFAMGKFTVFDLSTKWMYEQFPAAREDIQLSLLVSLAGGTVGGLVAAIVSNPGDATVSELKKAKSSMGPIEAAQGLVQRGGTQALFTGLPLRMLFYPLVVSLQFLIYDSVRLSLGIGSDDLKLYLDILGGALKETTGA